MPRPHRQCRLTPSAADIAAVNETVFATNDQMALSAAMRSFGLVATYSADELVANHVPTLSLIGDRDALVQDVRPMVGVMANLEVVEIPGATHGTAPAEMLFSQRLVAFLDEHRAH